MEFYISFKWYCFPELKFDISPVVIFHKLIRVLKIAVSANLGQLTRDIFRAINASAEI